MRVSPLLLLILSAALGAPASPARAAPPKAAPATRADVSDDNDATVDPKTGKKKADPKKGSAPAPQAAAAVSDASSDVLAETPAEKAKRLADEQARKAAEDKAAAEKAKKEADAKKAIEQKRADEEKLKKDSYEQRLRTAKGRRAYTRSASGLLLSVTLEPGMPSAGSVVELRVTVAQPLDVADPRYGKRMPIPGANLVATVTDPGPQPAKGKRAGAASSTRYALHPLDAPGVYGFHVTPTSDAPLQVAFTGTTRDGKSIEAQLPLHVGVWPPPDFDEEEQKNLATQKNGGTP